MNSMEKLTELARKNQEVKSKITDTFAELGIYNHEQLFREASNEASMFMREFQAKFLSQLHYDVLTNVPTGILKLSEVKKHALETALVGAIGAYIQWDITKALEIAADIAEDVNAHPEAKKIREMMFQEVK